MKYSPDEHDGQVPESETPETDKFRDEFHLSAQKALLESHERLERRLSLAQTEIKGLKERIEHSDTALRIKATECIMQSQRAEQAQARIAELEKALRRVSIEAETLGDARDIADPFLKDRA